jgi:hypothetical protein
MGYDRPMAMAAEIMGTDAPTGRHRALTLPVAAVCHIC